jgi:pSer/pThr/pTyr-binding forkhead associated (FHA) protein
MTFTFKDHSTFVVGRAVEAHFRLPENDPYVSRLHFMLEINPPLCRLLDMNSHNGTQVNGAKVENLLVRTGDRIKAGMTSFELSIESAGAATLDLDRAPVDSSSSSVDWLSWQRKARDFGTAWRVSDIVQRHPELIERRELLVELIAQEAAFRNEDCDPWDIEEYVRAYPDIADVLEMILGCLFSGVLPLG